MTETEITINFPNRHKAIALAERWQGVKGSQVKYKGKLYKQDIASPVIVGETCWLDLGNSIPGCLVEMKLCELQ